MLASQLDKKISNNSKVKKAIEKRSKTDTRISLKPYKNMNDEFNGHVFHNNENVGFWSLANGKINVYIFSCFTAQELAEKIKCHFEIKEKLESKYEELKSLGVLTAEQQAEKAYIFDSVNYHQARMQYYTDYFLKIKDVHNDVVWF